MPCGPVAAGQWRAGVVVAVVEDEEVRALCAGAHGRLDALGYVEHGAYTRRPQRFVENGRDAVAEMGAGCTTRCRCRSGGG